MSEKDKSLSAPPIVLRGFDGVGCGRTGPHVMGAGEDGLRVGTGWMQEGAVRNDESAHGFGCGC